MLNIIFQINICDLIAIKSCDSQDKSYYIEESLLKTKKFRIQYGESKINIYHMCKLILVSEEKLKYYIYTYDKFINR